jgi:hypothetical protein
MERRPVRRSNGPKSDAVGQHLAATDYQQSKHFIPQNHQNQASTFVLETSMQPQTARSTAENAVKSPLYHHEQLGAFECTGCFEMIEIPGFAVVRQGHAKVRIKGDTLNLLLWRELIELDHRPCIQFKDSRMAEQARTHRKQTHPLLNIVRRALA